MSKYDGLWKYVSESGKDSFKLTYVEIENIAGTPIDHSFLTHKKESIYPIIVCIPYFRSRFF